MRRVVRWGILLGALAVGAPARGDDAAQKDAQARFEEGLARVRTKDLEGALASFQQAAAILRKPAIVWNLALVEEKTNRSVEALAHFKEYLRIAPSGDPDRPRAQKHIDGLNGATGHIGVSAPTGATISVDKGPQLGPTPLVDPIDVAPGHHEVEARLGSVVKTVAIDAVAGQSMQADFGGMNPPGATSPQAETAAPAAEPAPVPPPDTAQARPTLFTPRVITAGSIAGAALVSLGVGVYFAMASNSDASSVAGFQNSNPSTTCAKDPTVSPCPAWKSAVDAQNRDTTLSTVFYVTSGVLAVGAVATYLLWPRDSKAVSMWILPTASPGGVGLGAVGRF
jgi:hypothetical protein